MKGFQTSHAVVLPGYVQHALHFFGHPLFILADFFFFFFFIINGARLDGVSDGEGEEEGSADVVINFMLMKISSRSLRSCLAGSKVGDQSQCEIWITTEYTKGSGSCSR